MPLGVSVSRGKSERSRMSSPPQGGDLIPRSRRRNRTGTKWGGTNGHRDVALIIAHDFLLVGGALGDPPGLANCSHNLYQSLQQGNGKNTTKMENPPPKRKREKRARRRIFPTGFLIRPMKKKTKAKRAERGRNRETEKILFAQTLPSLKKHVCFHLCIVGLMHFTFLGRGRVYPKRVLTAFKTIRGKRKKMRKQKKAEKGEKI